MTLQDAAASIQWHHGHVGLNYANRCSWMGLCSNVHNKASACPVQAMFRDTKLNRLQHSIGVLTEMLHAYHYWRPEDKHDFRAPNKPYRRL